MIILSFVEESEIEGLRNEDLSRRDCEAAETEAGGIIRFSRFSMCTSLPLSTLETTVCEQSICDFFRPGGAHLRAIASPHMERCRICIVIREGLQDAINCSHLRKLLKEKAQ
ncbi:unnamed protein product [Sphagnum jensenii]|jgi:hypothetical protein